MAPDAPEQNDIILIEDISRTTTIEQILKFAAKKVQVLGFPTMVLKMGYMQPQPHDHEDMEGISRPPTNAPAPNTVCLHTTLYMTQQLQCSDLCHSSLSHAQGTTSPESANGSLLILDEASSVEDVDLFNNLHNVVITNADQDVWQQIGKVNLNAHNPNPGAPEHLDMVNNLLGDNANRNGMEDGSNLSSISQPQWRRLREHVLTLSHPMTRCCFQCGMMNLPAIKGSTDIITVEDIHEKKHCRAYRVFKYYIKKLVKDRCERLGPDASDEEKKTISENIFLCEPADGGGSRVYACPACKRLCRAGTTADKKPRYKQCDPADLDLFDGVNEDDEFTSIGIGDKQPSVYAKLSCNDRMTLGVLKVSLGLS